MPVRLRVKILRREAGLTQAQLAQAAQMAQPTVSQIERGLRVNLTLDSLERLADALGVHISRLFEHYDRPDPAPHKPARRAR